MADLSDKCHPGQILNYHECMIVPCTLVARTETQMWFTNEAVFSRNSSALTVGNGSYETTDISLKQWEKLKAEPSLNNFDLCNPGCLVAVVDEVERKVSFDTVAVVDRNRKMAFTSKGKILVFGEKANCILTGYQLGKDERIPSSPELEDLLHQYYS